MNNGNVMGVFIGLESATYEYIANIIAPYQANFVLEIGDFLLIENMGTYIVSRVTEYRPTGELTAFMGQKWLGDVTNNLDAIGMDIKEKKIRYAVRIKILGTLDRQVFRPGVTKIPHITSKVYKPSKDQLSEIIETVNRLQSNGKEIGSLYLDKDIKIKFNISELNSKRTFVFARAGYGKSNLMKLISSGWPKGEGGLVIFDPEGEYAVTDNKQRPGIMDHKEAILVTNRRVDTALRNVYPYMKLNLREFDPKFILPIIVNPSKHETVFFSKLMGLENEDWGKLVDLLYRDGWRADLSEVAKIVTGSDENPENFQPVLNNLVSPIRSIHNPDSHLMSIITEGMRREEVVIVDISLLDSKTALQLSSMVVKSIFDHNQRHFTDQANRLIKATFVVEEAQSVIGQDSNYASFIELAKEGRKYGLGGIFITQQPGSIPFEILSQADNFFVFHLISRSDLESLRRANAHYSDDILTQILSEPIPGKCYMWTSFQPFVLPLSINNFENVVEPNRSIEVQRDSDLLANIQAMTQNRKRNPLLASIISKYNDVERDMARSEIDKRTIELFERLDENEKAYLREAGQLQSRIKDNVEFAVKTKYYNSLGK